jgi:hypothetical protein
MTNSNTISSLNNTSSDTDRNNPRENYGYKPDKNPFNDNSRTRGYSPGYILSKHVPPPPPPTSGSNVYTPKQGK